MRYLSLLAVLFLLGGCLLTPGKFASTLEIGADRHFAFTYKGEVYAIDNESTPDDPKEAAKKKAEREAKLKEMTAALTKEGGYRSVQYLGDGRFMIDYAIKGQLTHAFVFPFNIDAQIAIPFLAVEMRGRDQVRLRAPAFANSGDSSPMQMPGASATADKLDGQFTLTTDAEIVSQNSEDGAQMVGGRKAMIWRATPLTKDAPMAVLKVTPLQ